MREAVRELTIPVEDGKVLLAADLMRPGKCTGPSRVLVSMYPYHKDDVIGNVFEAPRRLRAEAGYATLLVDMRGHGASSGAPAASYNLGGVEGADGAAVVEWAAAQQWCNGVVGMWGVSYGAMTTLATAARRPPHLRAIVAVYGTDDCLIDAIAPGGSPYALGRYSWSAHMMAMDLCPPTRQDDGGRWRQVWADHLERIRKCPGHAFEWQPHIDDVSFWASRVADASRIEVPTFLIGGWHDPYADAVVRIFNIVPAERRLVIGPWLHVAPDRVDREPFDWMGEMCRWWDSFLLDEPATSASNHLTGNEPRAAANPTALIYVNGEARWRGYSDWPPPVRSQTLFFGPAHHLEVSPPEMPIEVHLAPKEVVGQAAGLHDPLGTGLGLPEDQHADDMASLFFETDFLREGLELAGRPNVDLIIRSAPSRDLRLVVRLSDVSAEGRSTLLTSGWTRARRRDQDGGTTVVHVQCVPVAAVIPAGHRLRVSVASSDFPRMWPTSGDGSFALVLGDEVASTVTLPHPATPGDDWTDRVPRPTRTAKLEWSVAGTAVLRRLREEPGRTTETTLEIHNELVTPHGATMRVDERFRARASAHEAKAAQVFGDVNFALELADGEKVDIAVAPAFTETTATAVGRVVLDGVPIFNEMWQSP